MISTLASKLENQPLVSSNQKPVKLNPETLISLQGETPIEEELSQHLPKGNEIRYYDIQLSPQGKIFAFSFRKELPSMFKYGVSLFHLETNTIEHLIPAENEYCTQILWHKNEEKVAVVSSYDGINFAISIVNIKTKQRNFVLADWKSYADIVSWIGEDLLVNSESNDQNILGGAILSIQTGELKYLILEDWPTRILAMSPKENQFVCRQTRGGIHHAFLLEENGKTKEIPIPTGDITAAKYTDSGKQVEITYESANSPSQTWVYNVASGQLQQKGNSLEGKITKEDFVQPQLITYPSLDGTPIAAFVYLPPQIKPDSTHPTIIYLHGGPTSQQTNEWSPEIQYLVSLGYIVIAANFRGSTSFGKEFQNANFQDLGGGDTEDAVAAADFAITSGYADPTKLVVMGHSYGGFLTIKAMQNFPTKWAAGVAQMPLVNMANAAKASPFLRGLLGKVTTKEEVNSYSPLSSMPKLQAPLLVQIGEQDTVCTPADAKQMQQNSKRVKIHLFADEEHSLVQEKNKVESLKQIAEFLKQKMP